MKFNQYLQSHAIDEWRRAYINYRQLKKQIGRAEEELIAIDEAGDEEKPATGPVAAKPEQGKQNGDAPPTRDEQHVDLERGRDESEEADDAHGVRKDRRNGSRPATPLSPTSARSVRSLVESPLASPGIDVLSNSSREHSDATHATDAPLVRAPSRASSHPSQRSPPDSQPPRPVRQPSNQRKNGPRIPSRRWRDGLSPSMELEEVYEQIPPQCRRFFTLLDRELERVTNFYADREAEAVKRYEQLSYQWKELANHKKEFVAHRDGECGQPGFVSNLLPKNAHLPNVPGSSLVRRAVAPRAAKSRARRGSDDSTDDGAVTTGRKGGVRLKEPNETGWKHGRPEEYTNARAKLKLATFEYYRSLGMLKSYRVLNRTGFAKGLKKFEKATAIPCAAKYGQKVETANFVTSTKLDDLIRETEDAFAEVFERGDRKKALERLRDFGKSKRHHFTTWRAGIMMGAGVVFMIEGLVQSFRSHTRQAIPYWPALMQLFGACYLPIFFTLAFFLNLAAWSYGRINYTLIFEFDVRTRMQYVQFIELPALLFLILSLFFWAAFNNFWPGQIEPSAYPLAWVVTTVVIMFNPLPFLYPSARWWMLRSFARMLTSGLVAVEFRDFFLGDEMNSLYYSIYNLGFLYCTYNKGWPDDAMSVCSTNKTWTTAILSALPAFIRLGQSIRRYLDSDGLYLHLLNAGKYTGSIAYFFAYYSWRIHQQRDGDDVTWRFALFIVFATLNSLYTSTWDILMDWSLGHRDVKKKSHRFLREELGYFKDQPWMYFVLSVANVLLRFSWVWYLAPQPSLPVKGYCIALLEASRRIMWNTLRVEAEHIGNRDGYRVTRDVSLPYVTASSPESSSSSSSSAPADDPSDDSLPLGRRTFASLHKLHRSIIKNFTPVLDAFEGAGQWVSLGRRVDEREREGREVEREREGEEDEEDEERKERERRRKKDFERKKRRRRRNTIGGRGEESSSSEGDEEGGSRSGSGSGEGSSAEAEAGPSKAQAAAAAAAAEQQHYRSFGSGAPLRSERPPPPADSDSDDAESEDVDAADAVDEDAEDASSPVGKKALSDEDRQLEEGMAEVEGMGMGKGLGAGGAGGEEA